MGCTGAAPTRSVKDLVRRKVVPLGSSWSIDLIRLQHHDDTVEWDLTDLKLVFSHPKTWFRIEFIDGPGGPSAVDRKLGPFKTLSSGTELKGETAIGKRGCYTYNLWVYPGGGQGEPLPIDPQIDHVAPPPVIGPIGPGEEGPGRGAEA